MSFFLRQLTVIAFLVIGAYYSLSSQLAYGSLVASYSMNGSVTDATGNGNNGVVVGAQPTSDRNGVSNNALRFDGVNDYVTITGNLLILEPTTNYSISMWLKIDHLTSGTVFQLIGNNDFKWVQFGIGNYGNGKNVAFLAKSNTDASNTEVYGTLDIGRWNHVVGIISNNRTLILYVNNVFAQSKTNASLTAIDTYPGRDLQLMRDYRGVAYVNGYMDNLRIYNHALTIQEIDSLYKDTTNTAPLLFLDNSNVSVYEVPYSLRDAPQQVRELVFHSTVKTSINLLLDLVFDISRGFWGTINIIIEAYLFLWRTIDIGTDPITIIPVGKGVSAPYKDASNLAVKLCDNGRVSGIVILDFIATSTMDWDNTKWSDLRIAVWSFYNGGKDWDNKVLLTSSEMASLNPKRSYIIIPKFSLDIKELVHGIFDAHVIARAEYNVKKHCDDYVDLKFDPSACGGANAGALYILVVDD